MLPLNKESLIFTEPPIMEHTGGEGWTILHGDTLSLLRSFQHHLERYPFVSGGRLAVKGHTFQEG